MSETSALKRLAQMSSRKTGSWYMAALEGVQHSEGPVRPDPGWFHPSTMSNECDAYWAFHYLGAPSVQVISAQTRRIFDNGSGRDEYLKRDAMKSGVSLIEEWDQPRICTGCDLPVYDNRHICIPILRIRGDLDDWSQNAITQRRYVVDFKTMREGLYNDLHEVLPSHKIQIHPYMVAKDTYEGFVLYENKNDQSQKCFDASFDNHIWDNIVNRSNSVREELEHNRVRRTPVNCSKCPFARVCTQNDIMKLKEESGLYV